MKRVRIKNICKLFCLLILVSCKDNGFYSNSKKGDVYRIPIKEPFEITSYSEGDNWSFILPKNSETKKYNDITNIYSVGSRKNYIIFYTPRIYVSKYSKMTEAWFIFNTTNNNEFVYDSKNDFDSIIRILNIESVRLYEVKQLFSLFDLKKELPKDWGDSL